MNSHGHNHIHHNSNTVMSGNNHYHGNSSSFSNSFNSNSHNALSSYGLAPFSLSNMTQPPRRTFLNTFDSHSTYESHNSNGPKAMSSSHPPTSRHPLQHSWTLHYGVSSGFTRQTSSAHTYVNQLQHLGTFDTVELFARYFNWIEKPHRMDNLSNYHLFKSGIKPVWEDPANANGGRWILTLLNYNAELLDRCWMELAYALVGEQLDEGNDICGAVLSRRTKGDRLAVWVRDRENVAAINGIGKRLIKILDIARERISLDFQVTSSTGLLGPPRSYISLDEIRRELSQEALAAAQPSSSESTPALSVTSHSTTPKTVEGVSPKTPRIIVHEKDSKDMEEDQTSTDSGLLISVNGQKCA
ncbi:hypothetical protein BGZ94_002309 [Podila epigama]|nr:hypothetical protein BGZ94_002309 [Podila epigama]